MTSVLSSPSRRVVKAKQPPSLANTSTNVDGTAVSQLQKSSIVVTTTDDASEEENRRVTSSYPLASPSVERELEMERTEKWRQQRLDALLEKQKQERGDKVDELRRSTAATVIHPPNVTLSNSQVPPEFSVEPQFPEHKRSGDGGDDEPLVVKRRKASVDEGDDDGDATAKNNAARTKFLIMTAALAAAMAIGVAFFRRSARG